MSRSVREYFSRFADYVRSVEGSGADGAPLEAAEAVGAAAALARERTGAGGKVFFIGNGGSAAIASHMATDWAKNGGVRAMAFNDGSLLTCLSNDYGYPHVFEKPIELFGDPGDLLFAISSSGRSENILRGVEAARARGIAVVTLSGFDPDNPLRRLGQVNLWVPAHGYGPVEVIHHALCHAVLDAFMEAAGRAPGCD